MNLRITLAPVEWHRALYEYLVRRGFPARLKIMDSGYDPMVAEITLEPCATCDNTTVIDGIGNRTTDCACAGRSS